MPEDEREDRLEEVEPRSGLTHRDILAQLDHILAHRDFEATEKMRAFFRFVVEETLAGRSHRIKGFTIATEVFGRGDDFDPSQDPIVRIQAGRLRRALERYYLVAGQREPILIDIPKGRYVPHFSAQVVQPEPLPPGASDSDGVPPTSFVGPSIAVLPFENLTGDPDQLFFTAGLTEELITELNRFQDFVVFSCHPAAKKTELPANPADLAVATGANFLLRGSVRRDPETVKVSVQLNDAKSGNQIWADAFKHPAETTRLIATQEEIAHKVVTVVGGEYGIITRRLSAQARKKPPAQLSTYEAMLRFYVHQLTAEPDSAAQCFPLLQQAVQQEPDYGPAWSALAALHCQAYMFDVPGINQPLDTALRYARRGVTMEPGSQLAHLFLASASWLSDDPDTSIEEIDTALALNPKSLYAAAAAGFYLVHQGHFERGQSLLHRAVSENPCHPSWAHAGLFLVHFERQDYENALRELESYAPSQGFWTPVRIAATLGKLGRIDEAEPHLRRLERLKSDFGGRARELFRRLLKVDALVDELIDGLRVAGLEFEGLTKSRV